MKNINVGVKVRDIRQNQKMSQKELSIKSGVAHGYIADLENNKCNNPSIQILSRLADALNVSITDLFNNL